MKKRKNKKMNQRPVYEINKSGKEVAHIGWAQDLGQAFRIASAYGHPRGEWRNKWNGSLGEGFAIVPKASSVEV